MKSYQSREGKVVKFLDDKGFSTTGIVVGCERNIGITVMCMKKKTYLLCVRHSRLLDTGALTVKSSDKLLSFIVKCIDNEIVRMTDIITFTYLLKKKRNKHHLKIVSGYASSDTCAFSS